jgi:hypothetical protein
MSAAAARWNRWWVPSFGVFLLALHLGVVVWMPARPLGDPGTGWHLKWGEIMLSSGVVRGPEPFLYLLPDRHPLNTAWLFDVGGAALVRLGGLPLFTAAAMVILGVTLVVVYRRAIEIGSDPLVAWAVTFGAYMVLLVHCTARPHQVTSLFFALVLYELERFRDGRVAARRLWWVPGLFALWTNLHGGFVAGLVLIGLYVAAEAVGCLWQSEGATARRAAVLTAVLVASALATLLNPYGWTLHRQIVEFLGYPSITLFSEFQSPQFHRGNLFEAAFELGVLLTFLLLARGTRKLPLATALVLAYFLGQSLQSVRHVVLFAIAAAPTVALLSTDALRAAAPRWAERGEAVRRMQCALRGDRVLVPLLGLAFMAASQVGEPWFQRDLVGLRLSAGAAEYIGRHRSQFTRMFNGEDTGGTLAWLFWPDLKIYIDDRLNGYGESFFRENYLPIVDLKPEWQSVLDRNGVTSAVMSRSTRYAALWRESPNWREVYADEQSVIYLRRATQTANP